MTRALALAALILLAAPVTGASAIDEIALGDSAWARRAEGERDGQPRPGPIEEAVGAYERALATDPGSLEARWKLLRALHFSGDFVPRDDEDERGIFDRAKQIAERGLDSLAARAGSDARLEALDPDEIRSRLDEADIPPRDTARLYFWSAIHWGAWSRSGGLIRAVRQGAANRIYDYTRVSIALDPEYDEGAGFRLLGRLHAELPSIPFVSGWVDRGQAIPVLERAYDLAPRNPGNRLLLALTLLDLAPERRAEALSLLEQVGDLDPRPGMRIEDLAMREEAGTRLVEMRADGVPDPDTSLARAAP